MAEVLDENGKPLFQVTGNGFGEVDWLDLAAKHRALAEASRLQGLYSEIEIAQRFGVRVRVVRERARERGLKRKAGGFLWFTEAESLSLWEEGSKPCSNSQNGKTVRNTTSGERSSANELTEALAFLTKPKPRDSSPSSKTTSLKQARVVPFEPPKLSRPPR
jgi:hypothetical protein